MWKRQTGPITYIMLIHKIIHLCVNCGILWRYLLIFVDSREQCDVRHPVQDSKSNSLRTHFALVFLQHTSFFILGRDGVRSADSIYSRCSDQNYQCTTK